MPIYESETLTKADLERIRDGQVCAECGKPFWLYLDYKTKKWYLGCRGNIEHEGYARAARPPKERSIERTREDLKKVTTDVKANKLAKYTGLQLMTEAAANEIVNTIWPKAPPDMRKRAMMICRDYNINPLLPNQIHMLFFKQMIPGANGQKTWNGKYDTELVFGIGLKRIKASRRYTYSYLNDSPVAMTDAEQMRINGQIDNTKFWQICRLLTQDGRTFTGIGYWPKSKAVKGADNGNSGPHMAAIHAESEAINKMAPELFPADVRTIDETYEAPAQVKVSEVKPVTTVIEGQVVEPVTGEAIEPEDLPIEPEENEQGNTAEAEANAEFEKLGRQPEEKKYKREPAKITDAGSLLLCCFEDWPKEFKTVSDVCKELNVPAINHVKDFWLAYKAIADARMERP